MKATIITITALACMFWIDVLQAELVNADWTSGHHEVVSGDTYGEIWMTNDSSADILGGTIMGLQMRHYSTADIYAGEIDFLHIFDNTVVNIYGGTLDWLGCLHNTVVNLYAYDTTYHPTGGLENESWFEGIYYSDNSPFSFTFYTEQAYSHLNVVPEPATLLLLGLGTLILRKTTRAL